MFFIFTLGNGGPLPGVPQFVKKIQDKASVQPRLGHQLMTQYLGGTRSFLGVLSEGDFDKVVEGS